MTWVTIRIGRHSTRVPEDDSGLRACTVHSEDTERRLSAGGRCPPEVRREQPPWSALEASQDSERSNPPVRPETVAAYSLAAMRDAYIEAPCTI